MKDVALTGTHFDFDRWLEDHGWRSKNGKHEKYPKYSPCHKGASRLVVPDAAPLVVGRANDVAGVVSGEGVEVVYALADIQDFHRPLADGWKGRVIGLPIRDHGVLPAGVLLEYAEEAAAHLRAGRKVGACCVGGHGRTGYFAAAVVGCMGTDDPIAFLREHHCKEAVESDEQVASLAEALEMPALKKHTGSKPYYGVSWVSGHGKGASVLSRTCADCAHYTGPMETCPVGGVRADASLGSCLQFQVKPADAAPARTEAGVAFPCTSCIWWGGLDAGCYANLPERQVGESCQAYMPWDAED